VVLFKTLARYCWS